MYIKAILCSKSDLSKEKIKGQDYLTFQPNTIVYAVAAITSTKDSRLRLVCCNTATPAKRLKI